MNVSGISSQNQWLSVSNSNTLSTQANALTQNTSPFANLNLTTQQQQQISQILQSAQSQGLSPSQVRSQIDSVLTPAQQTQLQRQAQGHHHHHHGGSASTNSTASSSDTDEFGIPTNTSATPGISAISDIAASMQFAQNPLDSDSQ